MDYHAAWLRLSKKIVVLAFFTTFSSESSAGVWYASVMEKKSTACIYQKAGAGSLLETLEKVFSPAKCRHLRVPSGEVFGFFYRCDKAENTHVFFHSEKHCNVYVLLMNTGAPAKDHLPTLAPDDVKNKGGYQAALFSCIEEIQKGQVIRNKIERYTEYCACTATHLSQWKDSDIRPDHSTQAIAKCGPILQK